MDYGSKCCLGNKMRSMLVYVSMLSKSGLNYMIKHERPWKYIMTARVEWLIFLVPYVIYFLCNDREVMNTCEFPISALFFVVSHLHHIIEDLSNILKKLQKFEGMRISFYSPTNISIVCVDYACQMDMIHQVNRL